MVSEMVRQALGDSLDDLTQEVGGATSGIGPALAQPAHQLVGCSGGSISQQQEKAPLADKARCRNENFLGQSVGLADG